MIYLVVIVAVLGIVVFVNWTYAEEIDVQRVEQGPYHWQATVREYPNRIPAILGASRLEFIFVTDCFDPGYALWYELPELNRLRDRDLENRIEAKARQSKYLGEAL